VKINSVPDERRYIATHLATDWRAPSAAQAWAERLLTLLLPRANPDYADQYTRIRVWWLEVDEAGAPLRELGLDAAGEPVVGGPIGDNAGFWAESAMVFDQPPYEEVGRAAFEAAWEKLRARWALPDV